MKHLYLLFPLAIVLSLLSNNLSEFLFYAVICGIIFLIPQLNRQRIERPNEPKNTRSSKTEDRWRNTPERPSATANEATEQPKPEPQPESTLEDRKFTIVEPWDSELTHSTAQCPEVWSLELLRELDWKRFEEVCAAYFKLKNLDARATKIGADGGVDIELYQHNSDKLFALMQCKAWKKDVGVGPVRELFGVMAAQGVVHGLFLTTSNYSSDALAVCRVFDSPVR